MTIPPMARTVVVDAFPESARRYADGYAIVAIDVIRAATTAVTAVATGRRCFPVASLEAAALLQGRLEDPLLVGELGGRMPAGFHLNNSPAALAARADVARPVILLSSSGTKLMQAAQGADAAYVACFRNARFMARYLAGRHARVAVIGAGSRGECRVEDQICCAWIAADLMALGYGLANRRTEKIVERWQHARPAACASGRSAAYLRHSGQVEDLQFVLEHVSDLDAVFALEHGEVVTVAASDERESAHGGGV